MTPQDAKLRLALRSYAAHLAEQNTPPSASAIWLRARQRERQLAFQRSAYPLRVMYALTVIAVAAACAWLFYITPNAAHETTWIAAWSTPLHSSAAKWLLAGFLAALAGWTLLFRATQRLFTA